MLLVDVTLIVNVGFGVPSVEPEYCTLFPEEVNPDPPIEPVSKQFVPAACGEKTSEVPDPPNILPTTLLNISLIFIVIS
jgi:hypothetical protein